MRLKIALFFIFLLVLSYVSYSAPLVETSDTITAEVSGQTQEDDSSGRSSGGGTSHFESGGERPRERIEVQEDVNKTQEHTENVTGVNESLNESVGVVGKGVEIKFGNVSTKGIIKGLESGIIFILFIISIIVMAVIVTCYFILIHQYMKNKKGGSKMEKNEIFVSEDEELSEKMSEVTSSFERLSKSFEEMASSLERKNKKEIERMEHELEQYKKIKQHLENVGMQFKLWYNIVKMRIIYLTEMLKRIKRK
ncbi:MAG TPA: hypothetical protein ENF30_01225 [Candidatus Desulfofervidus auxilii]|uniref:Uncharacterized protein n=1 Tax=Desulfofervidus auxilii TaxID=1621989 RepID=A0A7V0I9V9_DESA2|nr:hypothetical protein [Candidatus Desulfofervidus auxilii]